MAEKHIGGQAVIEGVMMRSHSKIAVSVRLNNGKIKTRKEKIKSSRLFKIPFIRGVLILADTLSKGMKALIWSADQQLDKNEKVTKKDVFFALLISALFAILFFIAMPFFLTKLIVSRGLLFNLVDGIFRLAVFFIYLIAISFIKDIKTVFQYHGAEHKAVNCYEAGKELTVKNAKKFTTMHRRCGTSFLLIVLVVSILLFSLIPTPVWYVSLLSRMLLIPVIASISYEILKLGDRYRQSRMLSLITTPGLLVQRLTTKEPTDRQIEVAIAALKAVLH